MVSASSSPDARVTCEGGPASCPLPARLAHAVVTQGCGTAMWRCCTFRRTHRGVAYVQSHRSVRRGNGQAAHYDCLRRRQRPTLLRRQVANCCWRVVSRQCSAVSISCIFCPYAVLCSWREQNARDAELMCGIVPCSIPPPLQALAATTNMADLLCSMNLCRLLATARFITATGNQALTLPPRVEFPRTAAGLWP